MGSGEIMKEKLVRVNFYIKKEQYEKLKELKNSKGVTQNFAIRKAIDMYFQEDDKNDKN